MNGIFPSIMKSFTEEQLSALKKILAPVINLNYLSGYKKTLGYGFSKRRCSLQQLQCSLSKS